MEVERPDPRFILRWQSRQRFVWAVCNQVHTLSLRRPSLPKETTPRAFDSEFGNIPDELFSFFVEFRRKHLTSSRKRSNLSSDTGFACESPLLRKERQDWKGGFGRLCYFMVSYKIPVECRYRIP